MATDNSLDGRNLKSTIFIDGEEYNVHAKTAERAASADKVAHKLALSVQYGNNTANSLVNFDGSGTADTTATINIPKYTLTRSGSNIILTSSDGSSSQVADYDTDGDGKVDSAEQADVATKVGHDLIINTGDSTLTYNGSAEITITKVNAAKSADTATNATTANKVSKPLKINAVEGGTDKTLVYDGSSEISITKVQSAKQADSATKVANTLTVKKGSTTVLEFNGSTSKTLELESVTSVENANKIQVTMNNNATSYATITVKSTDPSDGNVGDIWFKY